MNIVKAHQLLGQRFLARNGEKGWATLGRAECREAVEEGISGGSDKASTLTHFLDLCSLCVQV